jgi:hypothetical protein
MDYKDYIEKMRDTMHREIVQQATCITLKEYPEFNNKGNLELVSPIEVSVVYYYTSTKSSESILITGINCITGDIVSEDNNGDMRYIRYCDLNADDLADLHKQIVHLKNYSLKPIMFV